MSEAFVQHPGSVDGFAVTPFIADSVREIAPPDDSVCVAALYC